MKNKWQHKCQVQVKFKEKMAISIFTITNVTIKTVYLYLLSIKTIVSVYFM